MSDGTPVEVDDNINIDDQDTFENDFYSKPAKAEVKVEDKVEDVPADDDGAKEQEAPEEVDLDEAEAEAPADEEVVEDEDDVLKPKPKKKATAQERIAELTRARHDAERNAADLARRLADLEARSSQKEEKPEQAPARKSAEGAPDADSVGADGSLVYPLGEFDPNFIRDLTIFTIRQENEAYKAQREDQERQTQAQAAETKLQTEWNGKLAEAEKTLPDLRPTIANLEAEFSGLDPALGVYLAQTIMSMEVGPKVLYYLANNADEARKIIAAGPVGATLALGKLEDKIQRSEAKKASPPPARVSAAPTPPSATRGVGSRNSVADDTDDLDAFEAKFFKR